MFSWRNALSHARYAHTAAPVPAARSCQVLLDGPASGARTDAETSRRNRAYRDARRIRQRHDTHAEGGDLHATSQCAWLDHGTTAEILTADGTSRRTIPQGAQVVGCTPGGLLAADNQGHVWDLTNEKPAKPHTITPPAVTGKQTRSLACF